MPVYEYRCGECSLRFENFFTSMSAAASAPMPRCVACGSTDTRRCVSQVAQLRPVSPGVGRAAYPTSWTQAHAGDSETVSYWKRRIEREMGEESRDPGLKIERENAAEKQWNAIVSNALSPSQYAMKEVAQDAASEHAHLHAHGHDHPHPHQHDVLAPTREQSAPGDATQSNKTPGAGATP